MDEPDVFLDFQHLNALRNLINSHKGTLLVITHNRYLLNHCFNKILHLENTEMQEFDGNYVDYNFALLQMKIEQQELAAADMEEIERNRKIVERLRNSATAIDSATRGRSLREFPFWNVWKRERQSLHLWILSSRRSYFMQMRFLMRKFLVKIRKKLWKVKENPSWEMRMQKMKLRR